MKSSPSACPFDQISVLTVKNCPILRTAVHRIIEHCWKTKSVPRTWKHSFTIQIYKKDSPKFPSNFRPIRLQPVFAKVYSGLIRNRVFDFMNNNDYIETNIQKGFCKGISGIVEHTELLTYLINHARSNQRQLIVTMTDLKNAKYEIIKLILEFYHIIPSQLGRKNLLLILLKLAKGCCKAIASLPCYLTCVLIP